MKSIGERVRALREQHGLTQGELGNAIGVHQSTVSEIERGGNQPSIKVLSMLAQFFKVKPGVFLDGIEESDKEIA